MALFHSNSSLYNTSIGTLKRKGYKSYGCNYNNKYTLLQLSCKYNMIGCVFQYTHKKEKEEADSVIRIIYSFLGLFNFTGIIHNNLQITAYKYAM